MNKSTFGHTQLPLWFAAVGLALVAIGWPSESQALEIQTDLLREYQAPPGFSLDGFVARSTGGTTAIAGNFQPPGEQSGPPACYVIVADADGASGFPVRYQSNATACAGLTLRPQGGFFLRGVRMTQQESTPNGFTMKLAANGDTQWSTDDSAIADASDFRGMYAQPASPMAYNPRSEYLMAFTLGNISIGGQERKVTHGSSLRNDSGAFQTKVIRLGASQGFGVVGGVEPLPDSGDFLIFIRDPTTNGAQFLTYDGRQSVDQFEPRGEGWSQRSVVQMQVGPSGLIYVAWEDNSTESRLTNVTSVTNTGAEIWSSAHPPRFTVSCESESLGAPQGMWVGADNLVIFYSSANLRVIDSGNGMSRGVVSLSEATDDGVQPVDILQGEDGGLKLLAVSTGGEQPTFRELSMNFSGGAGSSGDVGSLPDGGCPTMDAGMSDGGDTRDIPTRDEVVGCGCRSTSSPSGVPALLFVAGLALAFRRRWHSV